jgi:hypothetical protein
MSFLLYLLIMLAVVPLAGYAVSGSWWMAWRYCLDFARVMLWTVAAGLLVSQLAY